LKQPIGAPQQVRAVRSGEVRNAFSQRGRRRTGRQAVVDWLKTMFVHDRASISESN
jgi:hypothetical protein